MFFFILANTPYNNFQGVFFANHCTNNLDGCSSTWAIEAGWTWSGAPSVCQKWGDGIHQGTESCDDGNTTNTVSDPKLGFPTKIH